MLAAAWRLFSRGEGRIRSYPRSGHRNSSLFVTPPPRIVGIFYTPTLLRKIILRR